MIETPKGSRNEHAYDPEECIYGHIRHIDEVEKRSSQELEEFFVDYHGLSGQQFRVLAVRGPSAAWRIIKQARHAAS